MPDRSDLAPFAARDAELAAVVAALGRRVPVGSLVTGGSGLGASRLVAEAATAAAAGGAIVVDVRTEGWDAPRERGSAALVVVADDAHQLDPATAARVGDLGRRHGVLASVPIGAALAEPLAVLWRAGRITDVVLRPLDETGVAALAAARLLGPIDPGAVHELLRRWGGNVRHTLAQLDDAVAGGQLAPSLGLWRAVHEWGLPPATAHELTARLGTLDADELEVVELLALAGPLGLADLRALARPAAVAALDDRGWLTVGRDGRRRPVELADPSVRTVVAASTPALRAATRVDAVLDRYDATGWRRSVDPVVRAGLLTRTDRTLTAEELLEAGRSARFGRRLDLAEDLARQAHAAAGGWEAAYLLGEVLEERGRREEADDFYVDVAGHTTSLDELALVAMATAVNRYYGMNRRDEARADLAVALDQLRGTSWEAEVECLLAVFAMFRGEVEAAVAVARKHQASPEPRGRLEAATVLGPALAVLGQGDEAVEVARGAAALRETLGDQYVLGGSGLHLVALANAQLERGEVREAVGLGTLITEASLPLGDRDGQAWGDLVVGRALLQTGDIAGAAVALREAAVLFADRGFVAQLRWARGSLALAAAYAGDAEGAARTYAELELVVSGWGFMEAEMVKAHAWALAAGGELTAARSRLLDAVEVARATGHRTVEAGALHDLVRLGAPDGPATELDELAGALDGPLAPLQVQHRRGLAAADDQALLAVAAAFGTTGFGTFAAEAAFQAAALRNAAGARREATRAAALALTYLPTPGLRTPAVLGAALSTVDLTPREREVALLAAEGFSSKEIAGKLVLSVRTVDNLLGRAYRKLGVAHRSELRPLLG